MAFRSLIDCGDLVLGFGRDAGTGGVTLAIVPRSHRDALSSAVDASGPSVKGEPVVQVALSGETGPGTAPRAGACSTGPPQRPCILSTSACGSRLKACGSRPTCKPMGWWPSPSTRTGLQVTGQSGPYHGEERLEGPLDLTMVTSFCLSGLSPFPRPGRAGNLVVHRLRSAWSLEAKLVSETLDDMHLEPAWVGNVATIERFGQVGTMAVRGFAPFVAVEDIAAGVTWAAQVAWSGSWQIELCRRGDASSHLRGPRRPRARPLAQDAGPRRSLCHPRGAAHHGRRRCRRVLPAPCRGTAPGLARQAPQ